MFPVEQICVRDLFHILHVFLLDQGVFKNSKSAQKSMETGHFGNLRIMDWFSTFSKDDSEFSNTSKFRILIALGKYLIRFYLLPNLEGINIY